MEKFNDRKAIKDLKVLVKALTAQVKEDKEYGNGNITDFGFNFDNEDAEKLLGKQITFVDFIFGHRDVSYSLAVKSGAVMKRKYPKMMAGANEVYDNASDNTTPPMTHAELLERAKASISAMA